MMPLNESATSRPLSQLQRWMQAVITHPAGVEAGAGSDAARNAIGEPLVDLQSLVEPSLRLSSADRMRVYGNAYFARLLECLRAEFPAMVKAIGEDAFDGLAFGYLLQHPSQSYTLARLAAELPDHLRRTRPPRDFDQMHGTPDFADFLIDLAQLERSYSEIFDGSGPERSDSLKPSDLKELSPEVFVTSRLLFHECVRLLSLRFPAHEFATSVRRELEAAVPQPRPTRLVVTRRDYVVRRIEISTIQFDLLTALQRGATIGEAIELLCRHHAIPLTQLASDLRQWFFEWSAVPLFRGLAAMTETIKTQ